MSEIQTGTSKQYGQVPFFYINGLGLSNDATTPNSIIDVSVGTCLDSTLTYQMQLTSAATVSSAFTGLGGLDTGTVAASTVYAVYLVSDPVDANLPGCILSTSLTGPLMPFGYSAWALIGYVVTDASSHFLKGYWSAGDSARRTFMYDTPQATSVTAGHGTTATAVSLAAFVPGGSKRLVYINTSYTPATAGNTLKLQPASGTGYPVVVTGPVTSGVFTSTSYLFDDINTGITGSPPEINYILASGSDAVAINVQGYDFNL